MAPVLSRLKLLAGSQAYSPTLVAARHNNNMTRCLRESFLSSRFMVPRIYNLSYFSSCSLLYLLQTFSELFVSFLEKESESQLISQSMVQPSPSGTLPSTRATTTVTAIPARLRDSPLPTSPLASSTPYGNAVAKPLLMNSRKEEVASGSNGTGCVLHCSLASQLCPW